MSAREDAGKATPHSSPAPGSRGALAALLLFVLALYLYPFFATRAQVGPSPLPPLFAPDLYLYLNLSHLETLAPHVAANPWYGLPVPENALTHKKFGLSFLLFDGLRRLTGGSWWNAVLLWTLLWTVAICLAAVWLLRKLLPQGGGLPLALSLALLLLLDLRTLPLLLSAWLHLPSLRGFGQLGLPYVREFFPQVVVPLLLAYVGLQTEALRERRWRPWLCMAAVQLLAFALFPYAMLLMAGTTGVILLLALARRLQPGYAQIAGFGLLCALLDGAYLLSLGPAGLATEGPAVALRSALLFHLLHSKTLLLVVVVTGLVCLARERERAEVKWTLASLGAANALLLVADGVLPPVLQIAHHGLYFVHTTLALQLAYLLAAAYPWLQRRIPRLRWALAMALAWLLAHGLLAAYGNYRVMLPFNQAQKEQAELLVSSNLQAEDLVIAGARFVDDTSCWAPLLSRAQVLFCRNAEFALPHSEGERIQDFRLGLYLDLTGKDAAWVGQVLSPQGPLDLQDFLSLTQERLELEGPGRPAALEALRARVLRSLARAQGQDPEAQQFFRRYNRIVVLDASGDPVFLRAKLEDHVSVLEEKRVGNYTVLWCRPR